MKRPATLILFSLAVVAGGVLFGIAFEVSALEERLTVLNKQITQDRDTIHVLRAEWSYLNQPERLEDLSRRYLELQPLEGSQLSEIAALPARRAPDPSADPVLAALLTDAAPAKPLSADAPIASALNAAPKQRPAAPHRPSRHVRLASQPVSPATATGTAASDKAALDEALRAIFGNTASNAGGASR